MKGPRSMNEITLQLKPVGNHCNLHCSYCYAAPFKKEKFKIYISALTVLNIDDYNRISTTDTRLIRRIVRDSLKRGHNAKATIKMWKKVREGEEKSIFPFQEEADVFFNSSLIYELSVLKNYALPLLYDISEDPEVGETAKRLIKILNYFLGVSTDAIPRHSILREFLGDSIMDVT